MTSHTIPEDVLAQHLAILGKTGSGKTSTEKLAVEQVVADGYRVCILDSVKSDWWGITSSADGKKPGLPFKILGGPHGHVPLHSSAGSVIGQLVGSGKLPLSIIDMADFEAGGLQRFFVDFAPALMKSMKGVIYLVIEEAHEFAPKERSGFGAENMAIHWAKKLATAGRSKGIRLIVATQRVQSLHNAVLGSCETMITHRLTAPADQEPILKWLKGNTDKETTESVAQSLSSLPQGTGWMCSGEAKIFKKIAFPKFKTYDNAATPTKDGSEKQVKTAPVDQDELRSIIGLAVEEAEANDPKKLRARIAELEKTLKSPSAAKKPVPAVTVPDEAALSRARTDGWKQGSDFAIAAFTPFIQSIEGIRAGIDKILKEAYQIKVATGQHRPAVAPQRHQVKATLQQVIGAKPQKLQVASGPGENMAGGERKILTALAQYPDGRSKRQVGMLAGYAINGGGFNNYLSALRSKGWMDGRGDVLRITDAGLKALGEFEPLPMGEELRDYWAAQLGKAPRAIFQALIVVYPGTLSKEQIAAEAGYEPNGGGFNNALSRLRTLELIEGRGEMKASDDLFQEAA